MVFSTSLKHNYINFPLPLLPLAIHVFPSPGRTCSSVDAWADLRVEAPAWAGRLWWVTLERFAGTLLPVFNRLVLKIRKDFQCLSLLCLLCFSWSKDGSVLGRAAWRSNSGLRKRGWVWWYQGRRLALPKSYLVRTSEVAALISRLHWEEWLTVVPMKNAGFAKILDVRTSEWGSSLDRQEKFTSLLASSLSFVQELQTLYEHP